MDTRGRHDIRWIFVRPSDLAKDVEDVERREGWAPTFQKTIEIPLPEAAAESSATPEEALEGAYQNLRRAVESDVLRTVTGMFSRVLRAHRCPSTGGDGYGGTLRDAGAAIGRTGDEGIDGIIKEDRLGLDVVYVQAKKWTGTDGTTGIQKFAGALQKQRARKGVLITTSGFSGMLASSLRTSTQRSC